MTTSPQNAMTKHKRVRRGNKSKKRKAEEDPQPDVQSAAIESANANESADLPAGKKSKKDMKKRTKEEKQMRKKEKKEKKEKKKKKKEKKAISDMEDTNTEGDKVEHSVDVADPLIDAVTISAADAASGMDIDRALKLAEKQRQRDKRAAKKAKAEQDAAKASKQLRRHQAAVQSPHDRRDSETPVWMACKQYLETWKRTRAVWKFQKVRQVWLLQHMYDIEQVSSDTFAILVEYLKGLKGAGRIATLTQAEKRLSESASAEGPSSTAGSEESIVQQRAAAVIKVLQQFEQ